MYRLTHFEKIGVLQKLNEIIFFCKCYFLLVNVDLKAPGGCGFSARMPQI